MSEMKIESTYGYKVPVGSGPWRIGQVHAVIAIHLFAAMWCCWWLAYKLRRALNGGG